jgi:hypothetical protein
MYYNSSLLKVSHPIVNKRFLKVYFFCLFALCIQTTAFATHIAGGDIQFLWTGYGNNYVIVLNTYVNEISAFSNRLPTSQSEYVGIYDKSTNQKIAGYNLNLVSNNIITSNSNFCVNPAIIKTSLQVYVSQAIDISPLDPTGKYYLGWIECCRNEVIKNLYKYYDYSAQQMVYQEIALTTDFNGPNIINSTPIFKPLKNEYFCVGQLNTFDMSATDRDGDKLVYSMVSPRQNITDLSTIDNVVWFPGYSTFNPIPGTVPLTINPNTGIMQVNPSDTGTFAFGIKVEEYRKGIKIGEARKDFQFNIQYCPVNNKPVIAFDNTSIKKADTVTVSLKGTTCFPIYITDIDASKFFISETITLNTTYSNSKNGVYPLSGFTIPKTVPLTGFRDTSRFNACFSPCAAGMHLNQTSYYPFSVVISDDRCPIKYDTLLFTIKVEVPNNHLPKVFIDPPLNPKKVVMGETLKFNVYGTDADPGDLLSLKLLNPQSNMVFKDVQDSSSTISSPFSWQPTCADLNQGFYELSFVIKDNSCHISPTDTVKQQILLVDKEVSFDGLEITNLITPNGDGLNDCYKVPGIPEGNCSKYFKGIEIYNRWGSRVFYSTDRFFNWCPNESDGVYYYAIDLNYEVRKGWLQITR